MLAASQKLRVPCEGTCFKQAFLFSAEAFRGSVVSCAAAKPTASVEYKATDDEPSSDSESDFEMDESGGCSTAPC